MSVTIELRPDTERSLRERAARSGQELESFVRALIEREATSPATLAEILAPFRAEVAARGISDAALDQLFDEARNQVAPRPAS